MRVIGLYFFLFPQTLENDLQSQKAELDDLKEDMLKKNLDVATVEKTLAEAGVNLEEAIPPAPDMDVEIEFVVEQFSGYIIAVQEWGAWFGPALATLERCKEMYKNRSTLEDMNDKLQVSLKQMHVLILGGGGGEGGGGRRRGCLVLKYLNLVVQRSQNTCSFWFVFGFFLVCS